MDVYKLKGTSLRQVEPESFPLERDIQNLVEGNIEEIFGLQFVATEFTIGEYRLDTLAFDRESSCFVIIEYKKGHSYSVIDQGYSYLSTMLQKKADFILEYNETQEENLKREQVDWGASKVIFVAPSFNSYQKNSVNFKDVPFELWEIKRFSDDTIVFNQHQATSKESIITPPSANLINQDDGEGTTVVHTVDGMLAKTSPECRDVWSSIYEFFDNLENTKIKVTRSYISILKGRKTVCYHNFQKQQILIDIIRGYEKPDGSYSQGFFTMTDPEGMAIEKERTINGVDKEKIYQIKVSDTSKVDYLLYLLKQKYDSL